MAFRPYEFADVVFNNSFVEISFHTDCIHTAFRQCESADVVLNYPFMQTSYHTDCIHRVSRQYEFADELADACAKLNNSLRQDNIFLAGMLPSVPMQN